MNEMVRDAFEQSARDLGSLTTRIAIAAAVIIFAFMSTRMVRHGLQRQHGFMDLPAYGQALILNVSTTAMVLIAGTAILSLWGVTWGTIAAALGVSTLAIALGLQDVLKSLAGGVVIMLERPFDIGDRIRIKDLEGEVIDIRVRSVVLRMDNGHLAQAPNGLLFSETFENLSRTEAYFYSVLVSGIADSPHAARAGILDALKDCPEFARPPDIVVQRDFNPHVRWPLTTRSTTEPLALVNGAVRTPRRRAVVSWHSDTGDASLSRVVELLTGRYPDAQIEVRKR